MSDSCVWCGGPQQGLGSTVQVVKLDGGSSVSLRLAVLALLSARPMTGFDLMRQFDASIGYVWHAPHPQIYPELRKLELAGLVDGEELPRGTHAKKRQYSITEAGLTELRKLVATVQEPRRERDPMRLKASYFEYIPTDVAREQLIAHLRYYEDKERTYSELRNRLSAGDTDLLKARLAIAPQSDHESIIAFKVFAYSGIIMRARTEIEWAREGLELLDGLRESSLAATPTSR